MPSRLAHIQTMITTRSPAGSGSRWDERSSVAANSQQGSDRLRHAALPRCTTAGASLELQACRNEHFTRDGIGTLRLALVDHEVTSPLFPSPVRELPDISEPESKFCFSLVMMERKEKEKK